MNFDGKLRPGDYATARIKVPAIPNADLVYDPALAGQVHQPHASASHSTKTPDKCPLVRDGLGADFAEIGFSHPSRCPMQRVVTVPRDAVLLAGDSGVDLCRNRTGAIRDSTCFGGTVESDKEAVIVEGSGSRRNRRHQRKLPDRFANAARGESILAGSKPKAPSYSHLDR